MTMTARIAVTTAEASEPTTVEVELRLLTLAGSANPLAAGGKLERTIPGVATTPSPIPGGTTSFVTMAALSSSLPSRVTFVLEAPLGKQLLELGLELVDYSSDWEQERVEILATCKGACSEVALELGLDPDSYSWRLSAYATLVGGTLELAFDLVQEVVATEFVDAQASARFDCVADGGGTQMAVIRPKRIKEKIAPTG